MRCGRGRSGHNERWVVPLNGEDVRFATGHSADNELQIDREVNHIVCKVLR